MFIAGEASGDLLAAELVRGIRAERSGGPIVCFGAGGPRLAEAGVELAFDLTRHAAVGLWEVLRKYGTFRGLFNQLLHFALVRKPDVIVCVDFSGFNRRFARAVRQWLGAHAGAPGAWSPRFVQYVSPQVWASRASRVRTMEQDLDLLLSIFPFEKDWYAARAPRLRVEFVGHPLCDRYGAPEARAEHQGPTAEVLLLPGSRTGELRRHLPVLQAAAHTIAATLPVAFRLVAADAGGREFAARFTWPEGTRLQTGGLADALRGAELAIASTGTVTMECAWFGVPAVTLYKTSWATYQIGRRIVKVNSLTMPNLLAGTTVYPEFLQDAATAENIARAALELLRDAPRRTAIRAQLGKIRATLGGPGANRRAAQAILNLL
jgi:lipid-A-disaccharide synthase